MTGTEMTDTEIQDVVKNTKLLLSFGSADSFATATEIRNRVMEFCKTDAYISYREANDTGFVYLDAETLKGKPGTYIDEKTNKVLNDSWEAVYKEAMKNCDCMLFIITKAWLNSKWCWQELAWYNKESVGGGGGRKRLTLLFLCEEGALDIVCRSDSRGFPECGKNGVDFADFARKLNDDNYTITFKSSSDKDIAWKAVQLIKKHHALSNDGKK